MCVIKMGILKYIVILFQFYVDFNIMKIHKIYFLSFRAYVFWNKSMQN